MPDLIIPAGCTLGECPVWDDRTQCLWWTDIVQSTLLRWNWQSHQLDRFALPERLGSFGLTSAPDWLICAFASGFALYHPCRSGLHWLHRVEPDYRGIRLNDGRVDTAGRFWAGSMVEDRAMAGDGTGSLYRLDPDGTLHCLRAGIAIANSICFGAAGGLLYFADSPRGVIEACLVDNHGVAGAARPFAQIESPGVPDGSDCDAQGRLWNAEWGNARLSCYSPAGAIVDRLDLPVSQPTCIAFGGPDFDRLFVTSAREGLASDELATQPLAGHVLVYQRTVPGRAAPRFPLDSFVKVLP